MTLQKAFETGDYYLFTPPQFSVAIMTPECLYYNSIHSIEDDESWDTFEVSHGSFGRTCDEVKKLSENAKSFNIRFKIKEGGSFYAFQSSDKASLIFKEPDGRITACRKVSRDEFEQFVQENSLHPWKNGKYMQVVSDNNIAIIKGNKLCVYGMIDYEHFPEDKGFELFMTHGTFKETCEEVKSITNQDHYNVILADKYFRLKSFGVFLPDEDLFVTYSDHDPTIRKLKWLSQEEFEELSDNRDPVSAPPGPYKIQPGYQGHLLWITGAPGSGKSTVAQLLGKHHDFVFYEGDCFYHHTNPYIPLDVDNPTMQQEKQKLLKGLSKERLQAVRNMHHQPDDLNVAKAFYKQQVENIIKERQRIGGDWAIAGCVDKRKIRDHIRQEFEPEFKVVFITLTLSKKLTRERLEMRHDPIKEKEIIDWLMGIQQGFEPVKSSERNSFNIQVSKNDTPEDVMEKILLLLDESKKELPKPFLTRCLC